MTGQAVCANQSRYRPDKPAGQCIPAQVIDDKPARTDPFHLPKEGNAPLIAEVVKGKGAESNIERVIRIGQRERVALYDTYFRVSVTRCRCARKGQHLGVIVQRSNIKSESRPEGVTAGGMGDCARNIGGTGSDVQHTEGSSCFRPL